MFFISENVVRLYAFFHAWLHLYDHLYDTEGQTWDQASFRSILWQFITDRSLRFQTFPPEFNLRTPKPWIAGRGQPVFTIHGRFDFDELDQFVEYLNLDTNCFRSYSDWLRLYPESSIHPKYDKKVLTNTLLGIFSFHPLLI